MKRIYLLILGLLLGIAVSGFFCSSVSQSGDKADLFYAHIKNSEFDKVIDLIDEQALKTHSKEKWIALLQSRSEHWGNLVSYKNTGFHTETANGVTITKLDFMVDNANGKVYERIDFVKRGSDYKILAYEFNPDKDKIGKNN
ncbi:MAG: hypothetical protein P1P88_04780 [Bacteroidales bacterium]|nr:hypothetical protein [Bacteroidales bacterium]